MPWHIDSPSLCNLEYSQLCDLIYSRGSHLVLKGLAGVDVDASVPPRAFGVTTDSRHGLEVLFESREPRQADRHQSALDGRYYLLILA